MKCVICDNQNPKSITHSFLKNFFLCKVCGGHFLAKEEKLRYPREYFEHDQRPSFLALLSSPVFNSFAVMKVARIKAIVRDKKKAKVLDYGCGSGKLVELLLAAGINTIGFEPSQGALQIAKARNLPVYDFVKKAKGGYDLIMFWHSLEHISYPLECIKKIDRYVAPRGRLLIAVPNAASLESGIARERWFHYTYPLHRVHFTPTSLETMLKLSGWRLLKWDHFNPEYSLTGLIQTFLNLILPKDVLYSVVTHRRFTMSLPKARVIACASLLLVILFSPLIMSFFILELIFGKTGAMVVIAGKDEKRS